jgi:hypothetical protein
MVMIRSRVSLKMMAIVAVKKLAGVGGFERYPFIQKCSVFKEFRRLESSVHSPFTLDTPNILPTEPLPKS